MDDLVRWLDGQLDVDAARAVAAAEEAPGAEWQYGGRYVEAVAEWDMVAVGSQDYMDPKVGEHIAEVAAVATRE